MRILDSVTVARNLSINYNKHLPEGHLDSSVVIKENTDIYLITAKILLQLSSLSAHSSCTRVALYNIMWTKIKHRCLSSKDITKMKTTI